jgi:hydroxymethylglutaryl-CoA reductase
LIIRSKIIVNTRFEEKNKGAGKLTKKIIENIIARESFKAGIMSGFGLGGGMFLVPMY